MKLSEKRGNMLHGILLIALFSCAAFYISDLSFVKSLSFSPGRDGSRLTRHPDRYHRRNGDHLWRCTDREMDENGKRDYFTHFGR